MLPVSVDDEGRLDVTTDPVGATSSLLGGIARNAVGQVHITSTVSDKFVNGLMVSDTGQLVMSTDPIVDYLGGFPRDALGRVRGQTDTTPDPKDPFVGGIRVGPLGGVYTTLTAPVVGDPPVNTVLPDVTGDAKVGSVLTCSTGTWTGATPITYTYQWYQGINTIVGATTNTYVVQAGDLGNVVICAVTATNAAGGATARSLGVRIVTARYNYRTNAGVPAVGYISAGSASAPNQVRINEVDMDGIDHNGPFSRMRIGDSVFVGVQEGIIASTPIDAGGYYIFDMVSWPVLADGPYDVTLGFNALFATNLDNDSFEDFPILQALGLTVTEDEDSYNIDFNGDGIADVIVPKP